MDGAEPAEPPITGYLDRLSCLPGGTLDMKVSVRDGNRYRVTSERLGPVRALKASALPQSFWPPYGNTRGLIAARRQSLQTT